MIKEETTMVPTKQITNIFCNVCGRSTKCPIGNFECISAVAHWGYSSGKDMETHSFHLCEHLLLCLRPDLG